MTRTAPKDLSSKKPETKQFYYLVAGNVAFYAKNAPVPEGQTPDIGNLPINAIIKNSTGQISTSGLADAQVALSNGLIQKIGDSEPVEIVDVQLVNICKLGHMTASEFHDLKLQEPPQPGETMEDHAPAKVH